MTRPSSVRITEVGPRDGLQNETAILPVETKIRFIDLLSGAGFAEIEVSSFVSPRWVPQLADAAEVFAGITRRAGTLFSALVPNPAGLERALEAGVDKIAIFVAASETFSRRNINASIAESLDRIETVVRGARAGGRPVRGYVSCVVRCPFEGEIEPTRVGEIVARLLAMGVDEIDLGETIGVAVPDDIERLYDALTHVIAPDRTTLHLHDTRGTALACVDRALARGVRSFDASCAGLGGCPYAPGAAGNLATEDLVHYCARSSIDTGIDRVALHAAGRFIAEALGRMPSGRVFQADGAIPSPTARDADGS